MPYPVNSADIDELTAHRRPQLAVGTIPHEVKIYFRCSKDVVYLSSESAVHILERHGDHIGKSEFLKLPAILERGLWIADRPECCSVSFHDQDLGRRYIAAVKVTKDRSRSYLTTLHFGQVRQVRALMRRGPLLRKHW